jgi:hypothetical protein
VVASTKIVARELRYHSAIQYVKARGWTYSSGQKLRYRQISEIIFKHAPGDSSELHRNFHAMVKRLYDFDKICMMMTRLACNRAIESSYWRMDNNSDVGLLTGYVLYRLPIELESMDLDTFSR